MRIVPALKSRSLILKANNSPQRNPLAAARMNKVFLSCVGLVGQVGFRQISFAGRRGNALLCSLQIEVRAQQLVAREHERPVFGVVVRAHDGEHEMMQVCRACATRNVDEIELHSLLVRRLAGHHPRPVASFAVVN